MTPRELLYETPVEATHHWLYSISPFVPEIEFHRIKADESNRIEIRTIKDICPDGRRCWTLTTVWFDQEPVMILQQAGREGRDHRRRFIVDVPRYWALVTHLNDLCERDDDNEDRVGLDDDLGESLTSFYNTTLQEITSREKGAHGA